MAVPRKDRSTPLRGIVCLSFAAEKKKGEREEEQTAFSSPLKEMEEKTNVMRLLDQKKIPYRAYTYDPQEALSGAEVAAALGQDPARVFKTLVTRGRSGRYYVFMVPVQATLNLKKAAAAVGEKGVEMILQKELLPLTGYIHGGCSPIGMKKPFAVTIDASAEQFETVIFSAGKIGKQVELTISDLKKTVKLFVTDVID